MSQHFPKQGSKFAVRPIRLKFFRSAKFRYEDLCLSPNAKRCLGLLRKEQHAATHNGRRKPFSTRSVVASLSTVLTYNLIKFVKDCLLIQDAQKSMNETFELALYRVCRNNRSSGENDIVQSPSFSGLELSAYQTPTIHVNNGTYLPGTRQ